jgi:transposase
MATLAAQRLDESAGKRRFTRTRQSTPWLKPTLMTAAWAATRKKDCYLRAQFLRIKSRRGAKKGILAVASSMLTAAKFMLRDGVEYHDLGALVTSNTRIKSNSPSVSFNA